MEHAARVTSSVIFVSDIDRSVDFYRDVFACEVTIQNPDAALLLAPGGFQIYLIGHSARTPHPSGGIGPQYLVWAVNSPEDLRSWNRPSKATAVTSTPTRAAASPSSGAATRTAFGY